MSARTACFNFYWRAQKILAPSLKHSQTVYEEVLFSNSNAVDKWLDLGCGRQLLPTWRLDQERSLAGKPRLLVGLDYDTDSLRKHRTIKHLVRADISSLPFALATFDLVTSNMVFEHLRDPENQLAEILRVLKPGGSLILHTPNSMGYGTVLARLIPEKLKPKLIGFLQGRSHEDVFQTFYRINTERAIREQAERAGFAVTTVSLIVSNAELVMIPPLVVVELLLIRVLMTRIARRFRTNIIAVLTKPSAGVTGPG